MIKLPQESETDVSINREDQRMLPIMNVPVLDDPFSTSREVYNNKRRRAAIRDGELRSESQTERRPAHLIPQSAR